MNKKYENNKIIAKFVGKEYQRALRRIEIYERTCSNYHNQKNYIDAVAFVQAVHRVLDDCHRNSRSIIIHDFLSGDDDSKWYLDYYSRTTYYRMKKKAVEEFVHCLNF